VVNSIKHEKPVNEFH